MMADIEKIDISERRRRQGVIGGSITKLGDKISELEVKGELSPMDRVTERRMQWQLGEANEEFNRFHCSIVDLLEQEGETEFEQANPDEPEYTIGKFGDRLQQLILQDESA